MIGNPLENRRAQRLSELLDEVDGGLRRHSRTGRDQELNQLAQVGQTLREVAPSVAASSAPDPDFQAALRRRLLAEATAQGIGVTAKGATGTRTAEAIPRQRTRRRFALAALVAGLVLGLSGVATASGDAVPGDTLYPVKRTTERAQLALAGSDVNRGQLYLEFARTRLAETEGLHDNPTALVTALADMDSDTIEGVRSLTTAAVERQDSAVLDALDDFTSQQRPGVVALMEDVGGEAAIRAGEAVALLDEVSQRSQELRNSLICVADDVETDRLGPVPTQCSALPGTEGEVVIPDGNSQSSRDHRDDPESSPGGPAPSTSESPSPSGTPSPSEGEDPEEDNGDEGGLLSELGDLLSGLLGG